MRAGGGSAKGHEFERVQAKRLSLWVSGGDRADLIWRSITSGAQTTVQKKKQGGYKSQAGDLAAIDPLAVWLLKNFTIECKAYKDLGYGNLILQQPSKIQSFWEVHQELCLHTNTEPLLISHQNHRPDMLLAPVWFMGHWPSGIYLHTIDAVFYRLQDFLDTVPYQSFYKIVNKELNPPNPNL